MLTNDQIPLCPLCLVVHTINLALLPTLFLAGGQGLGRE